MDRSEILTENKKENFFFTFNEKMEKALENFFLEEEYTPADIIKYSVMVTRLPAEIKNKLCWHADFNLNFFNDLKSTRYLGEMFNRFPKSLWLEKNFRKVKYELIEYLNYKDKGERYKLLIEFLESEETRKSVHFK